MELAEGALNMTFRTRADFTRAKGDGMRAKILILVLSVGTMIAGSVSAETAGSLSAPFDVGSRCVSQSIPLTRGIEICPDDEMARRGILTIPAYYTVGFTYPSFSSSHVASEDGDRTYRIDAEGTIAGPMWLQMTVYRNDVWAASTSSDAGYSLEEEGFVVESSKTVTLESQPVPVSAGDSIRIHVMLYPRPRAVVGGFAGLTPSATTLTIDSIDFSIR